MSAEVVRPGGERVAISWREHPGEGDVGSVGVGWRRPEKGEPVLARGDVWEE